jgi:multicomponent Na+:H+ antiporter subunit D
MPLFSWLPKAHGTPSSPSVVSAVLSGLYVKTGIYLFLRCQGAFSCIDTSAFFGIAGIITAVAGFTFAIAQSDIKLILSYHTVSQLGLIMVAINMGDTLAMWGGTYHIVNHAIFKSMLFLGAGEIINQYGTRNIYQIKGVLRRMPVMSGAMIAAILGITGAPLFNGSISKYLIAHGSHDMATNVLLTVINIGTIVSFIKFSGIFLGDGGARVHVCLNRRIACVILGGICFVFGILGGPIITFLFGVDAHIDMAGYLEKGVVYLLSVFGAWVIYRYLVHDRAIWKRVRALDLGFNAIAMTVVLFFAILTGYLYIA